MGKRQLRVATCQFAVSGSVRRNAAAIRRLMGQAKRRRAELVHLPECALSGYAGVDHESLRGFDWDLLREETELIKAEAKRLKLWVVLGSTHRLTGRRKPHNSLYVIDPGGRIVDRYDKRFCTSDDLEHYTPGDHFVVFEVNGVRCGLLICFDVRFPELYRELFKRQVDCVLQSFYNARQKGPSPHRYIMRQTMQCRAATNHFWVSMANSCAYRAPYPSCFIEPDGRIAAQLKVHSGGVMVNTVDVRREFYDPMAGIRELAVRGRLSNGRAVQDKRSRRRQAL